jgi:SAM-dependent methyltransferase
MLNPIIKDLIKLNLIKKKRLNLISKKMRNGKTKVFQDKISKLIFLEKKLTNEKYYKNKYENYNLKKNKFKNFTFEQINGKFIKLKINDDDSRRYFQLKNIIKKKTKILDFGCGKLSFLMEIKKRRAGPNKFYGIEKNEFILKKFNNDSIYDINDEVDKFDLDFDIITMFHVLHYLPNQIDILKKLRKKLKKRGKIIIEVPNALDVLFKFDEFKDFTLCKESLVWHTDSSIKKFLITAGFKKIKVKHIQRFGLTNHLHWLINGMPGGHDKLKKLYDERVELMYINNLIKNKLTDTLWVEATK